MSSFARLMVTISLFLLVFVYGQEKNILIDTTNTKETRIAVTEDGKLDDFEIESNKKNGYKYVNI